MVTKINKLLKKLSLKKREQIIKVTKKIITGKLDNLDVKKLKNKQNIYRVRVGSLRIIFYMKNSDIRILEIEFKSDNTYK